MAWSRSVQGYGAALASAFFLSTTSILIRFLVTRYDIPPLVLASWRNIIALITVLPFLVLFGRHLLGTSRKNIPFLALFGLVLAIFNISWVISVAHNGAAVATVLVYCSPAYTAILGWKWLGERLSIHTWVAIVLSLLGCVFVAKAYDLQVWQTNFLGLMAGLVTGLCYTAYSLMGRIASDRGLSPWTTLVYMFGFVGLYVFITNMGGLMAGSSMAGSMFWLGSNAKGWLVLIALGAIPTVAGYGFYNFSLTLLDASVANIVISAEPVFAMIFAYIFLHEIMTPIQLMGAGLLFLGLFVLKFSDLHKNME